MGDGPDTRVPVVIAGAGWAGLAAAIALRRHKVPVLLLEPARGITLPERFAALRA